MHVKCLTAKQLDWLELGWLAVWVLYPEGDYHSRVFEELPDEYREDTFFEVDQ